MPAMTTMLSFDTINHKVYSGDAASNLYEWDGKLNEKLVHKFDSPVTGANFIKKSTRTDTNGADNYLHWQPAAG